MKKTLIAMFALAGLAMADSDLTWTQNLTSTLPAGAYTTNGLQFSDWAGVTTENNGTTTTTASYVGSGTLGTDNLVANFLLNDDNKAVIYTFTITNTSDKAITLNSFSMTSAAANASGNTQGTGRTGKYTLTFGDRTPIETSTTLPQNGVMAESDFSLLTISEGKSTGYTLAAGDSVNVTLNLKRTGGQFYSCLSAVSVTGTTVPEPATATLSLLALAGLASRRRRH